MVVRIDKYYVSFLFSAIYIHKKGIIYSGIILHMIKELRKQHILWKNHDISTYPLVNLKIDAHRSNSEYLHMPSCIIHTKYKCDKLWK